MFGGGGGGTRKREKNKCTPYSSQVSVPSYPVPSTLAHPISRSEEPAKAHTSRAGQTEPGSPCTRRRGVQGVCKPARHAASAASGSSSCAGQDGCSSHMQHPRGSRELVVCPAGSQCSAEPQPGTPVRCSQLPTPHVRGFASAKQKSARLFWRVKTRQETIGPQSRGDNEAPVSKGGIRQAPGPSSPPPSQACRHGGCASTCQEGLTHTKAQGKLLL